MGAAGRIFISLSQNVSFMGKAWWVSMLVSRALLVLLAGFTLYSDDQGRFFCNTIQPGCSNACFDAFAPVSVYHLWLFHCILLCLPHALFATYVVHEVLSDPDCASGGGAPPFTLQTSELSLHKVQPDSLLRGCGAPRFHCSYLLTVALRMVLEAFCGAGQFFIFGLSVPKSFLCYEAPCVSGVECYVSKPTEKTLMLNFMLGVSSLSILLSLLDLVSCIKAMSRWRRKKLTLVEEMSRGERSSVFAGSGEDDGVSTRRTRPSGSSNDADRDGNHVAGGSNAEHSDPKVFSASTIQTDESACPPVSAHLRGAPSNPRRPTLEAATSVGLYSGQQSDTAESQDRRVWV